MPQWAPDNPLGALITAPPPVPLGEAVWVFALQWLIGCLLAALVFWGLARWIKRRRLGRRLANQRTLFVAFLLLAFGGANIYIEGRAFLPHSAVYTVPVQILFLLFFYVFSDERYTPRWARWLGIIYAFSIVAVQFPATTSNQNQTQDAHAVTVLHVMQSTPGVLGASESLANMFALWLVLVGLVPQIYLRYRQLSTAPERQAPERHGWAVATGALLVGGFLVLAFSGLFALTSGSDQFAQIGALVSTHAPAPLVLYAQALCFLLTALLPTAGAFAVLRERGYDRDALANRALVYGALTVAELLIYIAGAGAAFALRAISPALSSVAPYASIPFFVIIALIMTAAFRWLREQIQPRIDQRFFQRRFEAARTLAAWQPALREETVLGQLGTHLVEVVQKALRPDGVTLWLCPLTDTAGLPGLRGPAPGLRPLNASAGMVGAPAAPSEPPPDAILMRQQAGTTPATLVVPVMILTADDPSRAAWLRPGSVLALDQLPSGSLAADELRRTDMCLAVPLVNQGALAGVLALGNPEQGPPYTIDERALLASVADEAAPALRAALVAHVHDVEARGRERLEQELQTARRIQESLLPKAVPILAGWKLAAYYQPAREVGGDFYDFVPLADGRLAIVLGDVTDKGVPAALVMATTRSMLRAAAQSSTQQVAAPGEVLARVNELLCADLPASMFVTCFYAILDPASGTLLYANAGQDVPYLRQADGQVEELRATGMPLGLMPAMHYEEFTTRLLPGACVVFYSDGLVEAHNPTREMYSFPRLTRVIEEHAGNLKLIEVLLDDLAAFTGLAWEQEDDVTLVVLHRTGGDLALGAAGADDTTGVAATRADASTPGTAPRAGETASWRTLDSFAVASEPGNERQVIERVAAAVEALALPERRLEDLKTAVGEATNNAMEHGNEYHADLPVEVEVRVSPAALLVRITDQGADREPIPEGTAPDLRAKLAEEQSPRGWGLFLIKHLVDEMRIGGEGQRHTVELVLRRDEPEPA